MTQCLISCSFCGKGPGQVEKLIAGPGVYICNECVALCGDIVVEDRAERKAKAMEDNKDADPPKAPEREPTVIDLVANLRAACDQSVASAVCGDSVQRVVVLPVDLVLAIADGIEQATDPIRGFASHPAAARADAMVQQAAKDIVKLIVTRLFEPAKAEGEKALDACRRLGVTEEQAKAIVAPTMTAWSVAAVSAATLAIGGMLPWLMGMVGKRKGGLGG